MKENRPKIKIAAIIIAVILSAAGSAFAREVKFEASLNREAVAIGETAQLGLTFYETQTMAAPDIGNIDGLDIRYVGPSTMMTVISGRVSSSITHRYLIQPLRIGKFQIGPISFTYKQDTYASNMVILEVTEEKARPAAAPPREEEELDFSDRLFLTLNAGKVSAYVNELIPVTVKLYVNRLNVSDIQLPTFEQEGFSKIEFREPKQYRERMSGAIYDVLEFKTNIFGTKPGEFMLGPARIKCNVMIKKRIRRPSSAADDAFDDNSFRDKFFDDFFTRFEKYPTELESEKTRIIVSPLPAEGRPRDFSGAVGDYQFIFKASPRKVKAGDPITIRMDINGVGNFNTVLIPKLETFDGFRVYDAQVQTGDSTKVFTQVLMPETDQVSRIPKAEFNYFDPVQKRYVTIAQGPIPIEVEKAKEEAPAQFVGVIPSPKVEPKEEVEKRDIIYIKDSPGRWRKSGRPFYAKGSFGAFMMLPLVLVVSLYLRQARLDRFRRDTRYAGRILSAKAARIGLSELKRSLKSGQVREFYEVLFKALQGYLGNLLNTPPAGMTYGVAQEMLASRVEPDALRKIKVLFETCDAVRFAQGAADAYKMKDDLKEFREIVDYLERVKI